jgi:hypothetical protein
MKKRTWAGVVLLMLLLTVSLTPQECRGDTGGRGGGSGGGQAGAGGLAGTGGAGGVGGSAPDGGPVTTRTESKTTILKYEIDGYTLIAILGSVIVVFGGLLIAFCKWICGQSSIEKARIESDQTVKLAREVLRTPLPTWLMPLAIAMIKRAVLAAFSALPALPASPAPPAPPAGAPKFENDKKAIRDAAVAAVANLLMDVPKDLNQGAKIICDLAVKGLDTVVTSANDRPSLLLALEKWPA